MTAPSKLHFPQGVGSAVLAEHAWLAARETLAIQLFQQSTVDRPHASWILKTEAQRDSYRLMAQNIMYGEKM